MQFVNRKSQIVNGGWLPDMDLNHDKQIQSLLCYRYTIGQSPVESIDFVRTGQVRPRIAGFQTCRIADFQIGSGANALSAAGLETCDTADLEVCATNRN